MLHTHRPERADTSLAAVPRAATVEARIKGKRPSKSSLSWDGYSQAGTLRLVPVGRGSTA